MSSDYKLTLLPPTAAGRLGSPYTIDEPLSDIYDTSYDSEHQPRLETSKHRDASRWLDRWHIRKYFRLHDPEDVARPFRGWRRAVIGAAAITGFVLLVNTTFAIIATVRYGSEDGVGLIYEGDCELVKRWDTAIHLLINLLGTALLAASSFTMQCLSSPTRSEVDSAHKQYVSLDIGLASLKNLFYVKKWKSFIWFLLCFSTLPLHLLWNSTIFSTTGVNEFSYVVANQEFLDGASYLQPTGGCATGSDGSINIPDMIYQGYKAGRYSELNAKDCYNDYMEVDYLTSRRNLIVIIRPTTAMNMSDCGYLDQPWNGSSVVGVAKERDPDNFWSIFGNFGQEPLPSDVQAGIASTGTWSVSNHNVDSCWTEDVGVTHCQLQFISYILYIVVGCNLIKLVSMCYAAKYLWNLDEPILATVGDAISSFLQENDGTTKDCCLLDLATVKKGYWKVLNTGHASQFMHSQRRVEAKSIYRRKAQTRLYSATSQTRWWWSMIPCTLYLIIGFVLFSLSFNLTSYKLSAAMKLKFGAVDSGLLLGLEGLSGGWLILDVVIANSFQLALSTTYFLYNSLYTAQCAAREWASYIQGKRKALRVTYPVGRQRSTYYLQLPYRYGIPLTILLVLMHFLISQSIFLARLQYYDSMGHLITDAGFSQVGFSPRANLTTCLVGVVMVLAQVVNSFRPLDNRLPIHGNSSAVMSAMCHTRDDETATDEDVRGQRRHENIALRPITWGVTRIPMESDDPSTSGGEPSTKGAGHCSFTTDFVELPQLGKKYI